MEMSQFGARLDRIEDKLDRMTEALVALAKMEERMVSVFAQQDRFDRTLGNVQERVAVLEKQTIGRGLFFRWLDRAATAMIGAAAAVLLATWF